MYKHVNIFKMYTLSLYIYTQYTYIYNINKNFNFGCNLTALICWLFYFGPPYYNTFMFYINWLHNIF